MGLLLLPHPQRSFPSEGPVEGRDVGDVADGLTPRKKITFTATSDDGAKTTFTAALRLDTPSEVDYCRHGGILQFALRQMTA